LFFHLKIPLKMPGAAASFSIHQARQAFSGISWKYHMRFLLNSVRAELPCTVSVAVNLTTIEPAAQEPCLQNRANQAGVYF